MYKIPLFKIDQNEFSYYIAKIDVNRVKHLMTISPMEYKITNLLNSFEDHKFNLNDEIQRLKSMQSKLGYQRYLDYQRVDEIKEYIENPEGEYHIIPNSIIISMEVVDIDDSEKVDEESKSIYFLQASEATDNTAKGEILDYIIIPDGLLKWRVKSENEELPIFIIDGNHRINGIEAYVSSSKTGFDMPFSILLNRLDADQAEIFRTVNYKIKKVDKSYFYQILGEFELGQREYVFLHEALMALNGSESSPLNGLIKMTGKSYEHTHKQTLSQSFLIEQMNDWLLKFKQTPLRVPTDHRAYRVPVLRYLFDYTGKSNYQDSDIDNAISGNAKRHIGQELVFKLIAKYFSAIKSVYIDYCEENMLVANWYDISNVLIRPIGIGALIEVFPLFYMMLVADILDNQHEIDIDEVDFTPYINTFFDEDFDLIKKINSEYMGASGQGNIKKLADKMVSQFALYYDYPLVEKEYKQWYNKYYENYSFHK